MEEEKVEKQKDGSGEEISPEEEEQVKERLKALEYMD